MKRKTLWFAGLCLLLLLAMTACGSSSSPSDQVAKELDEIQSDAMEEDDLENYLGTDEETEEKYSEEWSSLITKAQDFDYEIKGEEVDEDTATVTVEITTYDFGTAYTDTLDQIISDAEAGKITTSTDVEDYVYKQLFTNLNAVEDKDHSAEVVINCTRDDDGDWETDIEDNDDFMDAVLGGLVTAASQTSTS